MAEVRHTKLIPLSKLNSLEQVCNGTLIRVLKDQAKIEVKKELSRFEDKFYEF